MYISKCIYWKHPKWGEGEVCVRYSCLIHIHIELLSYQDAFEKVAITNFIWRLKMVKEYSRGIIGQVQEKTHIVHRAILFKILLEEPSSFHVHLKLSKKYHKDIQLPFFLLFFSFGKLNFR